MTIGILIVSDVCLYREKLERALSEDERVQVVGTAASCDEAFNKTGAIKPDIVLLDNMLGDQYAFIRRFIAIAPETRIVAVTAPGAIAEVIALMEAGVAGYVPHDSSLEELIQCLEAVVQGDLSCSPQVAGGLLQRLRSLAIAGGETATLARLTPRESRILDLIEKGLPNKEIARALNVEVATIKNHVHSILQKLHVRHRREAAVLRREGGAHPCDR